MTEDRKTFSIPRGYYPLKDSEGRFTGEIRPIQWDSGSPSFNDCCLAWIELCGQDSFDKLIEPYVLWNDHPVPRNVPEDKFPEVYRTMSENSMFMEGLMRTGRRGMALTIILESAS